MPRFKALLYVEFDADDQADAENLAESMIDESLDFDYGGLPDGSEVRTEKVAEIKPGTELDGWALQSADSVEAGQRVDLGDEDGREGEPREVSGTSQAGTTVHLDFNDDEPGASFAFDERVWVKQD